MLRIRQALEKAVLAVTPAIDTAFENTTFNPRAGEPYQQLYFLPAKPSAAVIDDSISEVLGVFQITLRYPAGKGVEDVLERAKLYEKAFKALIFWALTAIAMAWPFLFILNLIRSENGGAAKSNR